MDERTDESAGRGTMQPGGAYAAHSAPQRSASGPGLEMLARALERVPLPPDGLPLVLADMGAAQGRSEMAPLSLAVRALRSRSSAPIVVFHTDLPGNDWGSLFSTVEEADDSYLCAAADVYPAVIGRSFYGRLVPDEHVLVGWSAIAVHWLSRLPADLPGAVYCAFAEGSVAEAFRDQARADWRCFLTTRAAELRPGGELVVVGGAADPDGTSGAEPLMGALSGAARGLVGDGLLRESELDRMTVPTWNRTLAEFLEPLSGHDAPLALVEHESATVPDVFLARFAEHGDARRLADEATAFVRAFTEPSLIAGIDPDRSEAARTRIADLLYDGVHARAVADPESVRADWRVVALRLRRPEA